MKDDLKEILDYNSETGVFTWLKKVSKYSNIKIGSVAGSSDVHGYYRIMVNGKIYKAHRLAWLYVYGEWPKNYIDHINGNPSDNRIENLRDVTRRQNQQNQKIHRQGHLVGVSYSKPHKKWKSQIAINGRRKFLGLFETKEQAHEVYMKELEKLK